MRVRIFNHFPEHGVLCRASNSTVTVATVETFITTVWTSNGEKTRHTSKAKCPSCGVLADCIKAAETSNDD